MDRERLVWIVVVSAILAGGLLVGRQVLSWPETPSSAQFPGPAEESFRRLFWENRALDLAAQIGLIFVAALGIAALLPRSGEDSDARTWVDGDE